MSSNNCQSKFVSHVLNTPIYIASSGVLFHTLSYTWDSSRKTRHSEIIRIKHDLKIHGVSFLIWLYASGLFSHGDSQLISVYSRWNACGYESYMKVNVIIKPYKPSDETFKASTNIYSALEYVPIRLSDSESIVLVLVATRFAAYSGCRRPHITKGLAFLWIEILCIQYILWRILATKSLFDVAIMLIRLTVKDVPINN